MASLSGTTPSSTFSSLIKTVDNAQINGTLKQLTDGAGNAIPMSVSTTAVSMSNAIITGSLKGTATTASYAISSSHTTIADYALNFNPAATASYAINALSASYAETAGGVSISTTGSTLYSTNPLSGPNFSNSNAIFLGSGSGQSATSAVYSNFFGLETGYQATGANSSNFLVRQAGYQATNAHHSNFFGSQAGRSATNASYSNFLGQQAGQNATNANSSNFLGLSAGYGATNAISSNFFGSSAGQNATAAAASNFLGTAAGQNATNAANSNFIGQSTGYFATNAYYSNFLGAYAGYGATAASHSLLIGYRVGVNYDDITPASIGPNNIIIGTNITVPTDVGNAINLGAIIFATGSHSNKSLAMPFSGSVGNGKVGINQPSPAYALDVSGSGNFSNRLTVGIQASTVTYPTASIIASNVPFTADVENHNIGIVGAGIANAAGTATTGWGVGGYFKGWTAGAIRSAGVIGEGMVSASADSGSAIGVRSYSNQVHANGANIGLYAEAVSGSTNYALYMNKGDIFSNEVQTWTLASGVAALNIASGLLNLDTVNTKVNITGSLNITGSATVKDILVLTPRTTTPLNPASGSFIVSGSGATVKPYFWDGSTWTPLY